MAKTINLDLYANLKVYSPNSPEKFAIEKGTTILDVLRELKIPNRKSLLIIINEKRVDMNQVLVGGEKIKILPPMRGG